MYNSKELEIMDNILIEQYWVELMLGIDNFYL
jgi:hypothetical protein